MSVSPRFVQLGRRRIAWREAGTGSVAIIVAGLGLSSRFYELSYAPFAAARIRLVVPDLPGWGRSPGPWTGLAPEDTMAFLLDFMAVLEIGSAVWIGHSVSAQAVVELAAQQPARAQGIVLVGPTGAPGRAQLLRQAWGLAVETYRTSFGVIRAVARDYVRTTPLHYISTWVRHSRHDVLARLPHVHCPALVVAGDADPVCKPEFVELLRHRLPHAQVSRVRGGTHALPRGHAPEFNRNVIAFVREVSAGAG